MNLGNILTNLPDDLSQEIFEVLVDSQHIRVERIISNGQSSPPAQGWYNEKEHEWVMVLKGEATIEFRNRESVHMNPGDYLMIMPHEEHRVSATSKITETIWLAIHYSG